MFILYDFIFLVFSLYFLPIYLFKGKFHQGFFRRLGALPKDLKLERPIWIHAVSVGEAMAVRGLIEELRKVYPKERFVISTVTPGGNKISKSIAREGDFVTYLPLDFSFLVRRLLAKINPSLFIIAETEIWPNLITSLYERKIPTLIVNGRISDRSFKGYLLIKFFLKEILNKITFFCVQSELDKERLIRLGALEEKIEVTGNMKFDHVDYAGKKIARSSADKSRVILGLGQIDKLLVAGSTHPGEEEIILKAYQRLLLEFPHLRLLLAPRHPERTEKIERLIEEIGFRVIRISKLTESPNPRILESPIFILDTIGELLSFYAASDLVFMGGSLVKNGGHNILEPASLGKPVIFGPQMFNFREIADLFLENQAAILVYHEKELVAEVKNLLNNPSKMQTMGKIAQDLILKNQGATQRNAKISLQFSNR